MEKKVREIIKCGNEKKVQQLSRIVENLDTAEVLQYVSKYITDPQFPQVLGYVLDGLGDSGQAQMMRLKITEKLLHEFQKNDVPLVRAMDTTSQLVRELPNFSTTHLTKIGDLCVECISSKENSKGNSSHLCWKEILPTVLGILLERVRVTHNTSQMTGAEYKTQVLKTICQVKWNSEVAVSLAGMFVNIPMTNEEHLQVVNKLGSIIEDLTPQEMPPLVHEMLELCHERHAMQLVMRLNHYFHSRLYAKSAQRTESVRPATQLMQFDSEAISANCAQEVRDAQSTALSYIKKSAGQHSSIGEVVRVLQKLSGRAPEYVLQPFLVGLLFTIGTLRTYEDQVFQILKSAFQRSVQEQEMRNESAWMRGLDVKQVDLENVISALIESSKSGQPDAEEGLVNLAFKLLQFTASTHGEDALAEFMWSYGTSMLVQLVKRQRHVAGSVIQRLSDFILTAGSVRQYTRCLGELCAKLRLVVFENQSLIIDLLGTLSFCTPGVARSVIVAVMPIVLLAPSVCNNLILTLRKAAFSRDVNTRKVSVYGFLEMLNSFKLEVGSGVPFSQGSSESAYSGYTILSQVSVEVHSQAPRTSANSKESVCLEILNALRGFFSAQAEVKACLFKGLTSSVRSNPALTGPVLAWLHRYFMTQCDLENLPPLHFDDCATMKGTEAVLQEPLGDLVQLIQEVLAIAQKMELESRADRENFTKMTRIMDKLVVRMARCHSENFGLEPEFNISETDPETKLAAERLRQALGVYEALMNYCISTWSIETQEQAEKVLALFKCYQNLVELACPTSRKNKKELDLTAKSQAKKGKGRPAKASNSKILPSNLGLYFLKRTLQLLHNENVPWCAEGAANGLKGKRDFIVFVNNVLTQFVAKLQNDVAEVGNLSILHQSTVLCRILFSRVALRITEIDDFDRTVAIKLLESFLEIVKLVLTHFKKKFPMFLQEITGVEESAGTAAQLTQLLEKIHSMLQDVLSEEDKSEAEDVKFAELLIDVLATFSAQLSPDGPECAKVTEWFRTFATEREFTNKSIVKGLVNVLLSLTVRTKTGSSALPNLILKLREEFGVLPDLEVDDESKESCSFPIICTSTKEVVLQSVCAALNARLAEVEWVTSRVNAEFLMLDFQAGDSAYDVSIERLKCIEQDLVCHLGQCVRCCVSLSACKPPEGTPINMLLRLFSEVYKVVTLVAKYFKPRSSPDNPAFEAVRFEKVVKLAGKNFTKHVFSFISYIGEKQDIPKKTKKSESIQKGKVLKETRYIPSVVRRKEELDQSIIVLGKHTKKPYLSDFIKYNVARDFNIKAEKLAKALEQSEEQNKRNRQDDGSDDDPDNSVDADVSTRSPALSSPSREEDDQEAEENEDSGQDNSSDEEENRPPPKKKRLSNVY